MRARVAEPPPEVRESRLLDRHGEPGDQPRDLIQMPGIMRFNGLREPKQAFLVAHGGNARLGRSKVLRGGRSLAGIEPAPMKPADQAFWPIESN